MFGGNPSLDVLTRATFTLSNKRQILWGSEENRWFLNWLGVSAEFTMLKTFFSIKTPTVRAAYEELCNTARKLRRSPVARVLFEIQDTVRNNCPMTADGVDFLWIAAEIGSSTDGMLDIAKLVQKSSASACKGSHNKRGHCRPNLFLSAAARRDIPMMKILVEGLKECNHWHDADRWNDSAIRRISFVMHQVYTWDPEEFKDGFTITDYIQLLIEGGILSTSPPASCCYQDRPKVAVWNPKSLTSDELIMMCPPERRSKLYSAVLSCSNDQAEVMSKAGVFTKALEGAQTLLKYFQRCKKNDALEILGVMQECLVFAASLNDIQTATALVQLGVDPEVGILSANQEWYHKGVTSWSPMLIAAAAGSLETLQLLSETSDLTLFLGTAPIYEICRLEHPPTKYGKLAGRELRRVENLRRRIIYNKLKFSDVGAAHLVADSSRLLDDPELWQPHPIARRTSGFFVPHKRRVETIAWIRTVAAANGSGATVDKEIIKAALCDDLTRPPRWQFTDTVYHPCDALLLDGLVDANLEYREGDMDLLQLSIRAGCSLDVVELLLNKGHRVHSRAAAQSGNTMLHDALLGRSRDRSKIVHLLLREGADLKHAGDGLTILEASLQWDRSGAEEPRQVADFLGIFVYLLDAGAPVQRKQRPRLVGFKPLIHQLVDVGAEDDLILRVVEAGADLNDRGPGGEEDTPLAFAIVKGRENLARELIRRGADVHAPAGWPHLGTALQAACLFSSFQFVEYLVKVQGVDVNEAASERIGNTALQLAVMAGSLALVELLLDHGADVNALSGRTWDGRFPAWRRALDVAAEFGRLDVVEFLLKAGGRSSIYGLGGAIELAKNGGHFALVSLLLDWEKQHGRRLVEEEVEWQQQHPDAARLLLGATSDDDFSDSSDSEGFGEELQ